MEKSSFFNSTAGDRTYQAQDFADYFARLVTNGIFPNPSTNLQVLSTDSYVVRVAEGSAYINGYLYINTVAKDLTLSVADGSLSRIDLVVVRLDHTERKISVEVLPGTPSQNPTVPSLTRNESIYELALAEVSVKKAAVSINQMDIMDTRLDASRCGVVNSLIEVDTTTIFNDYQNWYNTKTGEYEQEWETFFRDIQLDASNHAHPIYDDQLSAQTLRMDAIDQDILAIEQADYQTQIDTKLEAGDFGIGAPVVDISNTDLNAIRKTGFYGGANLTNAPTTNHYYVQHMEYLVNQARHQIIFRSSATLYDDIHYRVFSDGTWRPWKRLTNQNAQISLAYNVANDFVMGTENSLVQVRYFDGTNWRIPLASEIDLVWLPSTNAWRLRNLYNGTRTLKLIVNG